MPVNATWEEITHYDVECRRISHLAKNDLVTYPPILREPKDLETVAAVTSIEDKEVVLNLARSTVSITSMTKDGVMLLQCTGIITDVFNQRTTILTCAETVCDGDGGLLDCTLRVHFPDRTAKEGRLLFFDYYYNIALLEIQSDVPLCNALSDTSFSSNPKNGHEAFVLSRDKSLSLRVRKGSVLWSEERWLNRNCCMYLSCEAPELGTGGPVVNRDSNIIGMVFDVGTSNAAFLPSSIIWKCIDIYRKFSRVARPIHGLCLRSVHHMDVELRDNLSCQHNIHNGFIVDQVEPACAAETYGVRHGDVIVSFAGKSESLLQLEEYLLSLGWEFLERNSASTSQVVLELKVYNPVDRFQRHINLPVGFFESFPAGTDGQLKYDAMARYIFERH